MVRDLMHGFTITLWTKGRALVWDVTCRESFAPSNIQISASQIGLLTNHVATKKQDLYAKLSACHMSLLTFFVWILLIFHNL